MAPIWDPIRPILPIPISLSLSLSRVFRLLCLLVMHTVAAPPRQVSPVRSSAPIRRPSPLNPTRPRAAAPALTRQPPPASANTKTHLANLDRLLQKPSPAPATPLPPLPESHGTSVDMDGSPWGILNALNLSGVLPAARKVEDMSPRSLDQLQRLLTGTPRPSPRNGIGSRWRELHGARDWSGLLDPLDEDLRREIVRYGEFVQAAYHAFHSNPAKQPSDRRQVALPDRSYRVTRDLYATSSIEMPRLVDGVAPWMRQRTSWVGYVAVCDSEREIQRMGRRDVVIALRGTATALEWAENFRAALVKIPHDGKDGAVLNEAEAAEDCREEPPPSEEKHVEPKVECGFWSLFTTDSKQARSLRDAVGEEVRRLMEVYKGEQLSITITGHSLGAALAVLVADDLGAILPSGATSAPIAVFSFGSPRVGNREFAERVRNRGVKVLRVVNQRDVITRVPGVFADYQKVTEEEEKEKVEAASGVEARRRWWRAAAEGGRLARLPDRWRDAVGRAMTAWSYSHVGSELRVDSRQSPFLRPDAGFGCCHDLEAYLHLVDGFLSSRCPFRANAKRSIVKLMAHEGSSLKQHYTSRALAVIGMEAAAAADAEVVLGADVGGRGCLLSPPSS